MNIGVIGAGAWGSALAILIKKTGNSVILWSHSENSNCIENKDFSSDIKITQNMTDLQDCDAWVIAIPAAYFRETLEKTKSFYKNCPIIICTKGLDRQTNQFMSEILNEQLPECTDFGILSGPQFAQEVATDIPTGSALAGTKKTLEIGRQIFSRFYLEETDDIIGTQICGVGKNAMALISGFINETVSGENEKALIFTRAWGEIVDFGIKSGAKTKTFIGLAGLGDLFLSATSKTSRNYSAGASIAKNIPIDNKTTEGICALKGLIYHANEINLDVPILRSMISKMKL